ncbi:MAG: hypothetical protein J5642_01800 [Bacteroidales bacterium]|nr:hypothetical protein [Bacteroidales bacterium]
MKKIASTFAFILLAMFAIADNSYISKNIILRTVNSVQKESRLSGQLINRGVTQAAALWTEADGTAEEFTAFCVENTCKNAADRELLFSRLCDNFEAILGHNNRVTIELSLPVHVSGYPSLPIDELFAAYDGLSHFTDDMFNNKIAFIIILNFPHYTLKEKSENAAKWSSLEWGYARLGDLFTARVPADVQQNITAATTAADNYIANYNICMNKVKSNDGQLFWTKDLKLISHWGLRDELKAAYADPYNGLKKQQLIYDIMKRIIEQSIPKDVINGTKYYWYPSANLMYLDKTGIIGPTEKNARYQYLLNNFRAEKAADAYYADSSTFIDRRFNDDLEFSLNDIERLFTAFMSAPEVKQVASLISKKLDRKLQPFDIWYNGFKNRSDVNESSLDAKTRAKYPNKESFVADLPNILQTMGFTPEKARFICEHVTVDASVGAGHAWESRMKSDNSRLRTRIGDNGMDYKGFNIGIHEFGHNVEQTFSLHNVPNYFLAGVPNTAFTEALAFTFQQHDLELLGVNAQDTMSAYYDLLDNFWGCYEIMGVSLLDIRIWQWMYAHPDADAAALKDAVLQLSKDIWNEFYAPVFKSKDQTILAVYSHIIIDPLYLTAYPLGYLISFQLQDYFKDKDLGAEVERIYSQGCLIPQYWLQKAVGTKLTVTPFVKAAANAAHVVQDYEKQQEEAAKKTKKGKK